jgi:hypothetical protein
VLEGNFINILFHCKSVSGLNGELQLEPIGETLQSDCNPVSFKQKPIGLNSIGENRKR